MVLSPLDLTEILSISPKDSRALLLDMRRMNLAAPVPGPDERFRLTSQARHPLEHDLYPRQILLFREPIPGEEPGEIETWTYARRWELPYADVRRELGELVKLNAVLTKPAWQWNQHLSLLLDSSLWQHTATWTLGFLLALMAGSRLPILESPRHTLLATLLGIPLILHLPLPPVVVWNLRIALGLWLIRSLNPDRPEFDTRLLLFAATLFFAYLPIHTLPTATLLVHQTAWIFLWIPFAVLSLAVGVCSSHRPLRESSR
ncbi:MAG: hypothetical protein PF795_10690 [Kiritimatiellae bacterium]|jgi:hypothetical protein|nr:hypothetical protein [Kiritimatiellia bacterium]